MRADDKSLLHSALLADRTRKHILAQHDSLKRALQEPHSPKTRATKPLGPDKGRMPPRQAQHNPKYAQKEQGGHNIALR